MLRHAAAAAIHATPRYFAACFSLMLLRADASYYAFIITSTRCILLILLPDYAAITLMLSHMPYATPRLRYALIFCQRRCYHAAIFADAAALSYCRLPLIRLLIFACRFAADVDFSPPMPRCMPPLVLLPLLPYVEGGTTYARTFDISLLLTRRHV